MEYVISYETGAEKKQAVKAAESKGHRILSDTHYLDRKELLIDDAPDNTPLPMPIGPDQAAWGTATVGEKLDIIARRLGLER